MGGIWSAWIRLKKTRRVHTWHFRGQSKRKKNEVEKKIKYTFATPVFSAFFRNLVKTAFQNDRKKATMKPLEKRSKDDPRSFKKMFNAEIIWAFEQ